MKKWNQWKKRLSFIGIVTAFCIVIGAALWRDHDIRVKQQAEIEQVLEIERSVTCPALLSIARTPRDTLIVMKNKPVCVEYVFDNMK